MSLSLSIAFFKLLQLIKMTQNSVYELSPANAAKYYFHDTYLYEKIQKYDIKSWKGLWSRIEKRRATCSATGSASTTCSWKVEKAQRKAALEATRAEKAAEDMKRKREAAELKAERMQAKEAMQEAKSRRNGGTEEEGSKQPRKRPRKIANLVIQQMQ